MFIDGKVDEFILAKIHGIIIGYGNFYLISMLICLMYRSESLIELLKNAP